jgi:phosphoglycolate phosphatase-like HAD superfamily hydrolase
MRAILFDIDGTLLRGYGAGTRAMLRAGRAICGALFDLEGVMMGGGLDPIIYRQAAIKMGLLEHGPLHDAFRERYLQELHTELLAIASGDPSAGEIRRPELLPGINALLAELSGRSDVAIGLVTGNYQRAVPIKFGSVGLQLDAFVAGGFGDDADHRPGLVPVALARMQRALGVSLRASDAVIVGDTPRDVHCALQNGCRCLAVGTGTHPVDELLGAGAHRAVHDLSDPEPLLSLL